MNELAQLACGYTIDQLERFSRKARERCTCGSRSFEEVRGYPGEWHSSCTKCHRVRETTFNEGAVI